MSIETLHVEAYDLLKRDTTLLAGSVALLREDLGDLEKQIQLSIAKLGCCAVVGTPDADGKGEASRTILAEASFTVQIFENATLNRTSANSLNAGAAARAVARALHCAALPSGEIPVFRSLKSATVDTAKGAVVIWNVRFTSQTII